jgi:predicted transposase/invertase (TIGR01784 family)
MGNKYSTYHIPSLLSGSKTTDRAGSGNTLSAVSDPDSGGRPGSDEIHIFKNRKPEVTKQSETGGWVITSLFEYALIRQKRLLHQKVNYEVLEGFFSELLSKNLSVRDILEIKGTYHWSCSGVDILAEDEFGEILLIELLFASELDYRLRMLFGTSKTIADRLDQRTEYSEVRKTYSVNIVYFNLGEGDDYVYHGKTHFTGLYKNDELLLSDAQRKVFGKETADGLYPEYYILKITNFDDQVKDPLDEWIYFLRHNVFSNKFKAKGMDRARKALKLDNLTPKEQKAYDYMMFQRSDDFSAIASAKLEGRIEGREESRREREKLAAECEKERKEREERERELEKERTALLAEIARLKQNGK